MEAKLKDIIERNPPEKPEFAHFMIEPLIYVLALPLWWFEAYQMHGNGD